MVAVAAAAADVVAAPIAAAAPASEPPRFSTRPTKSEIASSSPSPAFGFDSTIARTTSTLEWVGEIDAAGAALPGCPGPLFGALTPAPSGTRTTAAVRREAPPASGTITKRCAGPSIGVVSDLAGAAGADRAADIAASRTASSLRVALPRSPA